MTSAEDIVWHRVAAVDDVEDGRVRTGQAGHRPIALTRVGDPFGAPDNRCPDQGGPLGEGSIEGGLLRCPWHGYDYDPLARRPAPAVQTGLHNTCFADYASLCGAWR